MYTVIRFYPVEDGVGEGALCRIGEQLNRVRAGSFDELSRLHKLFSVSVMNSALWWDHLAAMEAFLAQCGPFIRKVRKQGIQTQFSVAVWRQDYEAYNALGLPLSAKLVDAMAKFGVTIALRIYHGRRTEAARRKNARSSQDERELKKAFAALRRRGSRFREWLHKSDAAIAIPKSNESRD